MTGRRLGVDVGSVRVGVAMSDPGGVLASPLVTLRRDEDGGQDLADLVALVEEHEVVEVFVLGPGERYTEIELGPHGHHLVLRLHGARRPVESGIAIDYVAVHRGPRWRGMARVPVGALPPRPWRLNAYAIHGVGAARRYLVATPLGGDAPDFHRLDAFAIEAAGPKGPREF